MFFTGFGKFHTVLENPTTRLSLALSELLDANPIDGVTLFQNYVITTAIEDCDQALSEIYSKINQMIEADECADTHYVVLHMGVY